MATTSYGSITIVDVTDIGEFSLYPTCDLPLSVVYSPDDNVYTPNWGAQDSNNNYTNPLHLTPVVYYAGTPLSLTASGLSITWTRKVDTGSPGAISGSRGESVSNGVLTVNQNQFNTNMAMLTYICSATYLEPDTNQPLTAQGQITFSLVKQASTLKKCSIIGESAFKYATDQTTFTPASITLTASISGYNLTNGNWQYKNSSDVWTNFTTSTDNPSINSASIIIKPSMTGVFNNRIATIRKLCSDYVDENNPGTYDIHTIVQLYDGAAGDSTVAAVLDNEDQTIPCDSNNDPTIDLPTNVFTTFSVLKGGVDATGWSYSTPTITPTGTVTGSWNSTTHKWTLSTWPGSSNVATITFRATKSGQNDLVKYLQLTKIKTGQDGTSPEYYELVCSAVATNRTIGNVYSPSTLSFSANKIVGSTKTPYQGYIAIYENGTSGTNQGGAMANTTTPVTYTPSGNTLDYLTVYLYQTGGGGDILDRQTVVVTSDGQTGAQGAGALNIILGNSHEGIACTSSGTTKAQTTVTIPFTGYKGTTRQACSITSANISGRPTGCTVGTITNDNGSVSGSVQLIFANSSTLGGSNGGEITLTFSIDGSSIPMKFSWSKTFAGTDASPAVTFQCYGKSGDIIYNESNTVVLTSQLLEGTTTKTASSYTWTQWGGTSYSTSRGTTQELQIDPDWIDGYGAFRCAAVYGGNTYYGYISVRDVTDPLQVQVYSTLGEQLVNGVGDGAVFVRVMLNNEEVDIIKSTNFVTNTNQVSSPSVDDYCYLLNTVNATCTLMQYNGTNWAAVATDPYEYNYIWTFRNNLGQATTYNGNSTMSGKALYLGASVINKKLVMDVEVTKKTTT